MVKAIIFDIGGVLAFDVWENLLLDRKKGIAINYNLNYTDVKEVGKTIWDKFAYSSSFNRNKNWQNLEENYWDLFNSELNISIPIKDLINMTDDFIQPVEGMLDLVKELYQKDIKLAICSNNTEFWFRRQMNKIGYINFFDPSHITLSNRIGTSKSSHNFEMFKSVMTSLSFDKKSCLFIDDKIQNIEQATQFGLPTILFPSHSIYGHKYLKLIFKQMNIL